MLWRGTMTIESLLKEKTFNFYWLLLHRLSPFYS